MSEKRNEEKMLLWLTERIDGWIIPVMFGMLCVLAGAQFLTAFKPVRSYVDRVEGRFIQEPVSVIPSSVHAQTANLNLYISPANARPDISIVLNGKTLAKFLTAELTVVVHEGDEVQIQSKGQGLAYITVDADNSRLLVPAPGQVLSVSSRNPVVSLPTVSFTH